MAASAPTASVADAFYSPRIHQENGEIFPSAGGLFSFGTVQESLYAQPMAEYKKIYPGLTPMLHSVVFRIPGPVAGDEFKTGKIESLDQLSILA